MSSEILGDEDSSHRNFVRWYDPFSDKYQEQSVVVIYEDKRSATVWIGTGLVQATPVYINTELYTGNGIVAACEGADNGYRIVIRLDREEMLNPYPPQIDPGVLAIDGFLTEEEEAKILDSLGDDEPFEAEIDDTPSDSFSIGDVLKSVLRPVTRTAPVETDERRLRVQ